MESGRQKVTRKDVAREAGVSETIVSYVLNKNRYVKEEKRQRVLEVVEKLQYHPNNIARALHGKGSLQILFIAEELSSGYFSELVSQMSRDAYRRGYMISLCESQEKDEFVSQILSRQFDGLFVSASGVTDRELKLLVKSGIPMVLFLNREISCDLRDTVVVDTGLYEGSRECVKHLVKNGCRNFVYLDKTGKQFDRDIFRANIKEGTELGKKAQEYMDKGLLVPDELVCDLVVDRIHKDDCEKGYILDGFPRTIPQANALDEALAKDGEKIEFAIDIEVPDENIINRMSGRRSCKDCGAIFHVQYNPPKKENCCDVCGGELILRDDDKAETVKKRLDVYHEQTAPLIAHYKEAGSLHEIDGTQDIKVVFEEIKSILG